MFRVVTHGAILYQLFFFKLLIKAYTKDKLSKALSGKAFSNMSCYEEIQGSCECSVNGKPW